MFESFYFVNEEFPWFFAVLSAVFGAIVGSFLNVCIYRIPAERSVITPGSTCACGQKIPFYHNIPIFTWLFLRGKASCCGASFSIRYPAIELLTAILFLTVWLLYTPAIALAGMLFISFLVCATFIDFDHMIIPDRFSAGGMVIGVILSFFIPELHSVAADGLVASIQGGIHAIIGAVVGAGLVYWIMALGEIILQKPAMGEGDVKFVGFIGAFCGWEGAVFSMFGGAFIGTVILLPIIAYERIRGNSSGESESDNVSSKSTGDEEEEDDSFASHVPFGPMLALGGLIYFLGFRGYVDAYFANIADLFYSL